MYYYSRCELPFANGELPLSVGKYWKPFLLDVNLLSQAIARRWNKLHLNVAADLHEFQPTGFVLVEGPAQVIGYVELTSQYRSLYVPEPVPLSEFQEMSSAFGLTNGTYASFLAEFGGFAFGSVGGQPRFRRFDIELIEESGWMVDDDLEDDMFIIIFDNPDGDLALVNVEDDTVWWYHHGTGEVQEIHDNTNSFIASVFYDMARHI